MSLGTMVIGGLVVATFITLFVTPIFYVAIERLFGEGKARGGEPARAEGMPQPAE